MTGTEALALISTMAAALWLGVIVALHFIKPEFDPRIRMISEYARAPHGWIMQLAFFSVAVSCWALAAAIWAYLPPFDPALLAICGVGFAGAGAFITDPVNQNTHTRSGVLHLVFSFIVIPLFPIMGSIVSSDLIGRAAWSPIQPWLTALSILTWAGLICFIGTPLFAGQHARTPIGYFQRFMVFTYSIWLIAVGVILAS